MIHCIQSPWKLQMLLTWVNWIGNGDIYTGWAQEKFKLKNHTEYKCGVLGTSYPRQSIEKRSKFCFKWLGWLLLCVSASCYDFWEWLPHKRGVGVFCSYQRRVRYSNRCATCISHIISLSLMVSCETACKMHFALSIGDIFMVMNLRMLTDGLNFLTAE